jgi:transcriptional regulator with XRE-family HTH domain
MAKKFSELRAKTSPEARARVDARVQAALREMPLNELRRARELAQKTLGDILGMAQPEVSKLERRSDALISTIRHYVEAMGGELDIVARFPDGDVRITQFGDLDEPEAKAAKGRRDRRNQKLEATA